MLQLAPRRLQLALRRNGFFTRASNIFKRRTDYGPPAAPQDTELLPDLDFHRKLVISSFQRSHHLTGKPPSTGYSPVFVVPAARRTPHCYRCVRICFSETFKDCGFAQTPSAVLPRFEHLRALSASFITLQRLPANAGQEY
jgi:hypothetical protein